MVGRLETDKPGSDRHYVNLSMAKYWPARMNILLSSQIISIMTHSLLHLPTGSPPHLSSTTTLGHYLCLRIRLAPHIALTIALSVLFEINNVLFSQAACITLMWNC